MKKILIVNSNYYKSISDSLVKNAKKKIFFSKFALSKIDVPGIFEIPITIRKNIKKFRQMRNTYYKTKIHQRS